MAHYTTTTCYTMSSREDRTSEVQIWQNIIPEEALQHEFLMDGILAFSALHYASENPESRWKYTRIATHYQTSALRGYQNALRNITRDNHNAIFAYACMLNMLSLAFPNVDPTSTSHVESIVALIELVQGTGHITATYDVSLRSGKFAVFFEAFPRRDYPPAPDTSVSSALSQLREHVESIRDPADETRHQAYISGTHALEISFGHWAEFHHLGHLMVWTTMLGKDLAELFKRGDAMARLIFMHYGVLLLQGRGRWWSRNTGRCLIEELAKEVCREKPEWEKWTMWAIERGKTAD